jgi:hypothetical protein
MMGGYLNDLDEGDLSDLLEIITEWLVGFR